MHYARQCLCRPGGTSDQMVASVAATQAFNNNLMCVLRVYLWVLATHDFVVAIYLSLSEYHIHEMNRRQSS